MNRSNAKLFSIAGGLIVSALGYGLYNLYRSWNNDKLNRWLEDYIKEVGVKLKSQKKDGEFTLDIMASIMNLITEIEDFIFNKDYYEIEKKRLSYLNDSTKYEEAVNHALELHEKTFVRAIEIVEGRLKISCSDIQQNVINYSSNKEYLKALERNQKEYDNLPIIEKEKLRNAFLFYVDHAFQKDQVSKNLLTFPRVKHEYKDIVLDVYVLNKYLLKDNFEKEFGINEKYLYQLLRKHDLLDDPQISAKREVLLNI